MSQKIGILQKVLAALSAAKFCFYHRPPNPWISYINGIILVLTAAIGGVAYMRNPIEGIAYFRFYGIAIRRKNLLLPDWLTINKMVFNRLKP